jgi:N-terminal acetyltransferase B complex non-catalytic subunit
MAFIDYATKLADWIEPYHDHIRPAPATVLAEAARQTELKTGHSLKRLNGSTNGNENTKKEGDEYKKEKEPPVVKEAPAGISKYFEGM